jgi:hypothetical protein
MNKKKSTTNTARSRGHPAQLYQQCLRDERQAAKIDLAKLKVILAEILFFGKPLFEPPPVMDEASAIDKEMDLRIRKQLWQGAKYRQILSLLRRCSKPGDRLFLLAWWLSQDRRLPGHPAGRRGCGRPPPRPKIGHRSESGVARTTPALANRSR